MGIRGKITITMIVLLVLSLGGLGFVSLSRAQQTAEEITYNGLESFNDLAVSTVELSLSSRLREVDVATTAVDEVSQRIVMLPEEAFEVTVYHQTTRAASTISVPRLEIDGALLSDSGMAQQLSDRMAGDEVTFFLEHEIGLVRYDTSIEDAQGRNARWTYIPTDDERYRTLVTRGEQEFSGPATIVGEDYLTTYRRTTPTVISFAGVRQVNLDLLSEALLSVRIGETGYAYVLDENGVLVVHPELRGQDVSGEWYIAEMLERQNGFIRYVQGLGEDAGREKAGYYRHIPEVDWIVAVVPFLDEFLGPIRQIGAFIGIAIAIAAAVGVILSALLGTAISRPIRAVAERTSELAEGAGDLTFRFSTRQRDETGDLARHFNAFLETLQEVVRNVKATADEAEGLKTTVVSTSDQTTVATNEITANVSSLKELGTKLRSSVEKATGAVRSIQTALERFAHEVDEEASAVEESSSSIEEMAASITAIAQTSERRAADAGKVTQSTDHGRVVAGEISQNVEQFVRRLEEIRQASSLIQDVAAQTNLLAMNAAIEAAHAGDAGRGFAVVAGEIRKLAEETSTRSASINESVQGFNHDIEALVESNDSVQESFGEIQQRVSDFVAGFTEIQGTTRELSVGANEIVNAIQVLRTGSSNVQSGTGDISRQTDVIADVMRDVQGATQSLSSALDEVSQGLAEINEGSVNLRDGIVRLGDTVDSMASGVRSFRTE